MLAYVLQPSRVLQYGWHLPHNNKDLEDLGTLFLANPRVVHRARAITFQLAKVTISGDLFNRVLSSHQRPLASPGPARERQRQSPKESGFKLLYMSQLN